MGRPRPLTAVGGLPGAPEAGAWCQVSSWPTTDLQPGRDGNKIKRISSRLHVLLENTVKCHFRAQQLPSPRESGEGGAWPGTAWGLSQLGASRLLYRSCSAETRRPFQVPPEWGPGPAQPRCSVPWPWPGAGSPSMKRPLPRTPNPPAGPHAVPARAPSSVHGGNQPDRGLPAHALCSQQDWFRRPERERFPSLRKGQTQPPIRTLLLHPGPGGPRGPGTLGTGP